MPKNITDEDLDLLSELGVDLTPKPVRQLSAREERIIAGFEEIERFVEEHGRLPQHGADRDIFERIYAVRLDRLRESEECRTVLTPLDSRGLLNSANDSNWPSADDLDDAELLAALGVDVESSNDLTQLTHVRSRQEIKAAEEIAQRDRCQDFENFKPLFKQVQKQLETGERETLKYQDNGVIRQGDLFILDGQKLLVAEMGESFISDYGLPNCRLRVVYDNGTESNPLLRSLQRALNKDKNSRRITSLDLGPLFSSAEAEEDLPSGFIYVLRSKSEHPYIAENREVIHKIGVTGGDVRKRLANAKKDPTYLLAEVEIVTTFKLMNIDRNKLEALLHRFFDGARLDITLYDRFNNPVKPKEWFCIPLEVIEQAIEKLKEGTLDQFHYDPQTAQLLKRQMNFK
ncbi:GIY-YIG nuclease family protein (plasmid) [Synechococcus elongatus PCC 11801]|uniref:GIY-YIG nuclease family protein n=1 Tax=Synechococcus elongatus PCC 11801 TaxID=2219813 RepID=A0ACD5A3J5_SYNEL